MHCALFVHPTRILDKLPKHRSHTAKLNDAALRYAASDARHTMEAAKDFEKLLGIGQASSASPTSYICEPGDCSLMLALSCRASKEEIWRLLPAGKPMLNLVKGNLPQVQRRTVETQKDVLEARTLG